MKKINIGLVDDHLLFAEGIGNMLSEKPELNISFITSSAAELFDLLSVNQIDILLLDINMPPLNGMTLIPKLKKEYPHMKIMVLTMYQPMDIGLDMKQFIGDAYVLKISGKQILEEAFSQLLSNQVFIDPNIVVYPAKPDVNSQKVKLTKREIEIVRLIVSGKTTKDIAQELYLSELTIKTHRKNISEKMDSKGLADLIAKTKDLIQ
jgi:DNA-binding NarL/FixJ family response regulator